MKPGTHKCVYAIKCNQNGRLYIGVTCNLDARIRSHFCELRSGFKRNANSSSRRNGEKFQSDYNKYGCESFEVYVLEENIPPEKANEAEARWIEEYRTTDERYGYNSSFGSARSKLPTIANGLPPKMFDQS